MKKTASLVSVPPHPLVEVPNTVKLSRQRRGGSGEPAHRKALSGDSFVFAFFILPFFNLYNYANSYVSTRMLKKYFPQLNGKKFNPFL